MSFDATEANVHVDSTRTLKPMKKGRVPRTPVLPKTPPAPRCSPRSPEWDSPQGARAVCWPFCIRESRSLGSGSQAPPAEDAPAATSALRPGELRNPPGGPTTMPAFGVRGAGHTPTRSLPARKGPPRLGPHSGDVSSAGPEVPPTEARDVGPSPVTAAPRHVLPRRPPAPSDVREDLQGVTCFFILEPCVGATANISGHGF